MTEAKSIGLIGNTGFVGGALSRRMHFERCYNSKNIDQISGQSFDLLVCAGVSAEKWRANAEPELDRAGIRKLSAALANVRVTEFVLISTIDVYPDPSLALDEDHEIDPSANNAYGRHRYELECWVRKCFLSARIIRLPALFGKGLKKNVLYDLLNDNLVYKINPNAIFQWYPISRLAHDIEKIRTSNVRLANLFTAPMEMAEIIDAFFPGAPVGARVNPAQKYCLQTKHAGMFGGRDGFILSAETVLGEMARFIIAERRRIRM
jgi:hypothetical protein